MSTATALLDQVEAADEATITALTFYYYQLRAQMGRGRLDPRGWQAAAADATGDTAKAATLVAWAAKAVDAGAPDPLGLDMVDSTAGGDLTGAAMVADVAARDSAVLTAMADLHDRIESLGARGAVRADDVQAVIQAAAIDTETDGHRQRMLRPTSTSPDTPSASLVAWAVAGRTGI